MKALILAAGRGGRLDDVVEENKCLLQVYGTPVLEFSLNNALAMGVDEVVLVVGHMAEDVINRYGNSYKGKKVRYVIQKEQKGLVHAIETAQDKLDGDDIALFLGDEVMFGGKHKLMRKMFEENDLFGVCGMAPESDKERIKRTYQIFMDNSTNRILRLVEKPRRPHDNQMGTGNCIFKNTILDYIPLTPINPNRGEKELPDLIQCAIDDGAIVKAFQVCQTYFNINSQKDLVDLLKAGKQKETPIELPS